ncbi:MAG TPA: hypothetical protein VK034_13685 [Enhygromyxa sp.]|nr:hypothetical protein [Enhygromyxa sp.]
MATFTPEALNDLSLTVDLGERLTLIFVFGPGYLASDGLGEIAQSIGVGRRVLRHRLDRLGPNVAETIASVDEPRPVVLVSGLERMTPELHARMLESMNLLRDTLNKQPAVVVMWIPSDVADEFRRVCIDLFQWRTLTMLVDSAPDEARRAHHAYLVGLASAHSIPPWGPSERFVTVDGQDRRPVDGWLARVHRGLLLGPPGAGKTTELRRHAARQAAAILDGDSTVEFPVFVAVRRLDGANVDWRALAQAAEQSREQQVVASVEQRLASGHALLLVDGVDELPPPRRAGFEDRFVELVASSPDLRVIVASRDGAADPRWQAWQQAHLEPLDADAIAASLRGVGLDQDRFLPMVMAGPIAELAKNPLSLGLMIELLGRDRQLPTLRITELTKRIVDERLGYWDRQRGVTRFFPTPAGLLREFLSTLAARMTRKRLAAVDLAAIPDSAQHQLGIERSGLLRGGGESGAGHVFVHDLFREYLAGEWLLKHHDSPEQLARYAIDEAWQGAVVHALALLHPTELEAAFEQIWKTADTLPSQQRWTVRRVALAGALQTTNSRLREQLLDRGFAAVDQAQRDGESPELWRPIAQMLDDEDYPR